jgi:uncharacterized protein YneR
MPLNFYELYNLINEYGQSLIQTLIQKFQEEDQSLTITIIRNYIDRFERIKNNLPEKDITKYSWKELENTVDGYQPKQRIKAGKLDPTVSDANLLYNQNGTRIYLGRDKKSCIIYGNGYSFCISARGKDNMYGHYRIVNKGTPYFVFNDKLPITDNRHLMVLFVYQYGTVQYAKRYSVTLATNKPEDETEYETLAEIINLYPWTKPLENFIDDKNKGTVKVDPLEEIEHRLSEEYEWIEESYCDLNMGDEFETLAKQGYLRSWGVRYLFEKSDIQKIKDFLNNDSEIASVFIRYDGYSKNKNGDHFFTFYKNNTDDILKQIKIHASEDIPGDFKYKKSDSELQQKIAKALKFKFKTLYGYLNNYTGEGDVNKYDDGEAANVKFEIESKNYEYFFAKIVNISNIVRTDENIKKIENLFKSKIKQNKILNWLKIQNKETLEKILKYRYEQESSGDDGFNVPLELKMTNNLSDFISKFMEMFS